MQKPVKFAAWNESFLSEKKAQNKEKSGSISKFFLHAHFQSNQQQMKIQ